MRIAAEGEDRALRHFVQPDVEAILHGRGVHGPGPAQVELRAGEFPTDAPHFVVAGKGAPESGLKILKEMKTSFSI